MFEKILAYRPNTVKPVNAAASPPISAATVHAWRLASLKVCPSQLLWRAQVLVHILLAVFSCWALWSWLLSDKRVLLGLVTVWIILFFSVLKIRRRRVLQYGVLSLEMAGWFWLDAHGRNAWQLKGEVAVWPWLIILPFVVSSNGRATSLVLLPDSMSTDDWRHLRIWLRTVLPRQP